MRNWSDFKVNLTNQNLLQSYGPTFLSMMISLIFAFLTNRYRNICQLQDLYEEELIFNSCNWTGINGKYSLKDCSFYKHVYTTKIHNFLYNVCVLICSCTKCDYVVHAFYTKISNFFSFIFFRMLRKQRGKGHNWWCAETNWENIQWILPEKA